MDNAFDDFWFSNKPKWIDQCEHKKEEYIGSFMIDTYNPKTKEVDFDWYDLYIFQQTDGQYVCIRYGNVINEYLSPGELSFFLQHVWNDKVYKKAFELLRLKGKFIYEKKV